MLCVFRSADSCVCVFYLQNETIPYLLLQLYSLFIMPQLKYLLKISTSVTID